jgi:hypothetical protein
LEDRILRVLPFILTFVASAALLWGPSSSSIVINEIELNPPTDDPFAAEWVELFNTGPDDVDIGGWQVVILSTIQGLEGPSLPWSGKMVLSPGTILKAGGYRIVSGDPKWEHGINASAALYTLTGEEIDKVPMLEDDEADGSNWSRYPNGKDTDRSSDWAYIPSTKGFENKLPYD